MQTATAPDDRQPRLCRNLYSALLHHLHHAGVTVTHGPLTDLDATWSADTATFTLRDDADIEDHIAALGDLARMITLQDASARGAFRLHQPRHLHAVPS